MDKKRILILVGLIFIYILFLFNTIYLSLTTLSFKYASFLIYFAFNILNILVIYLVSFGKVNLSGAYKSVLRVNQQGVTYRTVVKTGDPLMNNTSKKISIITGITTIALILLAGLLTLVAQPIFRSNEYYDVIDSRIEEQVFTNDFEELSSSNVIQLPNIDSDLAQKKATTLFGETKGFGSEYQLGMFTDQIVNGKFVTVAPIEYNGFFKYNSNKNNGTPGFIVVDKSNYSTDDNGTKMYTNYNLKFLPSSYFSTDLKRHVYFSGYANKQFSIAGFELDDNFNPYWIINIYENTVFPYGLKLITSVLTVDAQNGKINEYNVNELDELAPWIDNVQDTHKVMEQVNNYGKYESGFMNSIFAQRGVTQTTHGSRHVVLDNELYLFTGLTSVGADESISQILLINKKTLNTKIYNVSGATEYVAMSSAEGKLQNYGYDATFPIPVNVNGVPSYFIPLKDSSGLIKHYTFVQISNHTVIGAGATINEAYINYVSQLSSTDTDKLEEKSGIIKRINFIDGVCYLLLEGDNEIYYTTSFASTSLVVSAIGDNVSFKVLGNMIVEFKNNSLENN